MELLFWHRPLAQQMYRETEYDVNPYELMPVSKIALWTLREVLKGRPSLILDFIAQGRRAKAVQAEVKERQRLLDTVA
jgi:hypothetical protein